MKINMGTGGKLFLLGLAISALLTLFGSETPVISPKMFNAILLLVEKCHVCSILDPVINTISSTVSNLYKNISGGLIGLLLAFFAIWLVIFTMKYIASPKSKSGEEFFTDLIKQSLMVLFISLLIASTEGLLFFFDTILYPLIKAFVSIGLDIVNSVDAGKITCAADYKGLTVTAAGESGNVGSSISSLGGPIKCLAEAIHAKLMPGMVFGAKMLTSDTVGLWPEFVGLFLFLVFLYLDLLFPLQLFDSLFRMAIMMLLFPMALMLAAFKISRSFIVTVFMYFMATVIHLVVISVIFSVCIIITTDAMQKINPDFFAGGNPVSLQKTVDGKPADKKTEELQAEMKGIADNDAKKLSSLQIKEVAMIAILIYMLYIVNLFNELVMMVAGIGIGNTMSVGVRDKGIKTGLGVADGVLNKATGGRMRLKG